MAPKPTPKPLQAPLAEKHDPVTGLGQVDGRSPKQGAGPAYPSRPVTGKAGR